ncbi:CP2 transcription factor-domain-containing protein [Zychaea mexicana]|uniref:CP2 transcription factor-domain-containing protein n=1 Tax=Zychaea mexicana TaxID=64656 RepID=UPI0022FDE052|nr:CP2 transcription factor-domain-containing protein [Zychaea mexicana]KAI9490571.1 CP2 transcription factor-domain-containing protein [Zychaea mexicana]
MKFILCWRYLSIATIITFPGQYYCITLADNDGYDGIHTSTLAIMFHDESHRRIALNYWRFWLGQQREPDTARALEINAGRCSGIHNVQCDYFDRITFNWHGKRGAKVYVRFNCLSTDFSRIKGVKGIPLRLYMETQGTSAAAAVANEHSLQQHSSSLVEATYCRIKLFRDKGAERKNKDDQRHIEKQLEKVQGNPGEAHPLLGALRREIRYTAFSDIAEELSPPVMSTVALEYSNNSTATTSTSTSAERFKSCKPSITYAGSSSISSSSTYPSQQNSMYDGNNNPLTVDGLDSTYVPIRRRRHAVLSLFARGPNDEYYRAIYLDDLSVQDLIEKLSSKLNVPVPVKNVIRHVSKTDSYSNKHGASNSYYHNTACDSTNSNTIVVRVDDAVVRDIPEQQDMEVEIKFNDDGFATLVLCY